MAHPVQGNECSVPTLAMGATFNAGASALAAGLFTSIAPVGGAVFGASYYLGHTVISYVLDKINCSPDSCIGKVATCALSVIGGVAAAAAVTTLVGFPMTFAAGATLALASMATTAAVFAACLCCVGGGTAALLGGAALAGCSSSVSS